MLKKLENLDKDSYDKLKDAVVLITILVAGADGKIDFNESNWSNKLMEIRAFNSHRELVDFYKEVGKSYQERFDYYVETLPVGVEARNQEIADKLEALNDILPKLGKKHAKMMYNDLLSFANHVAKTSGGFLGFMTVSRAEEKVMGLDMINKF